MKLALFGFLSHALATHVSSITTKIRQDGHAVCEPWRGRAPLRNCRMQRPSPQVPSGAMQICGYRGSCALRSSALLKSDF